MKAVTEHPAVTDAYPLAPLRGLPELAKVEPDRRVIRGAAIIQSGPLNTGDARPWLIDETTLQQVLALGNASQKGLKARWSHPNQSNDGLGTFLGRWRRFRLSEDGSTVLADLHLARSAFRGQDGGRGQYVLDLATEDAEAFGVSIYPSGIDTPAMSELQDEDGVAPLRIKSLQAADVVDSPAATRGGFFGGGLSVAQAPIAITEALNSMFAEAEPEVIRERAGGFLDRYLANRFHLNSIDKEDVMSEKQGSASITEESLGESLATFEKGLLAKVDDKLKALNPGEGESDDGALSQNELLANERTRCSELYALAQNAGLSDWQPQAQKWINAGLSVVEAKAAIADLAIAGNALSKDAGEPSDDPDARYKAEYQRGLSVYAAEGISEAEFIESAKITEKQSAF